MSEKNKEIVKKVNDSFASGSTDGFLEYCTEDVVWSMAGEKTNKGKPAIREWMSQMEGQDLPKFTVDRIIAESDSVVCYGDMTMKGEDGVEGKYSYCDIYRFSGDKIAELLSYVVKHKTEGEADKAKAA